MPAQARTGIVAGGGLLPVDVARALIAQGERPFVVLVEGEVSDDPVFARCDSATFRLEEFAFLVRRLRAEGVTRLVLAGTIARRPSLRAFRWSLDLLRALPRAARAMASGDDVLLRAIVGYLEDNGIEVVGADRLVPDLLTAPGGLTRAGPGRADRADIAAALTGARALGALDVGQAAVAIGGRVMALEDIAGTQELLRRTARLRGHGRLAGKQRGVLAKCAKPGQELRADLPAIGPETVDDAAAAGLAGIVLEAERSFVLAQAETIARADAHGLFILGVEDAAAP